MKKLLFLALLPFLTACKKDKDDDKKNEPILMPLAIGNQWVYEHREFDDFGAPYNIEMEAPMVVLKAGTRSGYFSVTQDNSEQYTSSATEILGYFDDEDEYKFLKSAKVDTFKTYTDTDGTKTVSVAYPDTSQVLTYNSCYRNEYLSYNPNGELYSKDVHYVSPGIGIVRMETYSNEGNGAWELDYRVDLKSYIIK
jgi:hypothetical protein